MLDQLGIQWFGDLPHNQHGKRDDLLGVERWEGSQDLVGAGEMSE
jgi:hypothetical protein